MRASTAYFIGGGTIVAAIAIGLGGGIVAGNIMNPIAPKHGADSAKVERRAEPVAAMNAPAERLQYLTGSQAFGALVAAPAEANAPSAAAKSEAPAQPTQTATATEPKSADSKPADSKLANSKLANSKSADSKAAEKTADHKTAPQTRPAEEQQAAADPAASVDNAYAKARDSDVRRAASERRRAERRQRWAERRHYEPRERLDSRDRTDWNTDWNDVARNVREDSESRDYVYRPRPSLPQIRLFDDD
jgi:hypothetical protein